MIAFFGEFLAKQIHPRMVIVFCMVYPILMGTIGMLMDTIDEKLALNLELVAELYGLFYASLPYKLVYLDIEELEIGFIVLGVKLVYKLIVYVIVPLKKHKASKKKSSSRKIHPMRT
jgi:1,4-dihydroxy-2-naphthoate octaprenyltransferase